MALGSVPCGLIGLVLSRAASGGWVERRSSGTHDTPQRPFLSLCRLGHPRCCQTDGAHPQRVRAGDDRPPHASACLGSRVLVPVQPATSHGCSPPPAVRRGDRGRCLLHFSSISPFLSPVVVPDSSRDLSVRRARDRKGLPMGTSMCIWLSGSLGWANEPTWHNFRYHLFTCYECSWGFKPHALLLTLPLSPYRTFNFWLV